MTRLFWRLVHLLPWRITRHVCDLCDEFPEDPKAIVRWFDDDTLTEPQIREHLTEEGWEPVEALPAPLVGWSCQHWSITGRRLSKPTAGCGCDMQPLYASGTYAA